MRLLRKNHGFVPERIFDTMLASRLLGDREFGLANLLQKHLGVTLEKGSQKADWAKRPLTPRMEAYARNDTHYLAGWPAILREQLREKGRLGWAEESCARLIAECAIPTAPQPDLVWRVKGSHKLSRAALAVLRELWQWRETEAIGGNKPPFFVLGHEALVEIAAAAVEQRPFAQLLPRHFSRAPPGGVGLGHPSRAGASAPGASGLFADQVAPPDRGGTAAVRGIGGAPECPRRGVGD